MVPSRLTQTVLLMCMLEPAVTVDASRKAELAMSNHLC